MAKGEKTKLPAANNPGAHIGERRSISNHGGRNAPSWNRMTRRERERFRRTQDIATLVDAMTEMQREHNKVVLRLEALRRLTLRFLHEHPAPQGIVLLNRNAATLPAEIDPARFDEILCAVIEQYATDLKAGEEKAEAEAGDTMTQEENEADGPVSAATAG